MIVKCNVGGVCDTCIYLVVCVYGCVVSLLFFFFFKQKTAYEMRISDWSSDVCSSDRALVRGDGPHHPPDGKGARGRGHALCRRAVRGADAHRRKIGRASCRERVCQYV